MKVSAVFESMYIYALLTTASSTSPAIRRIISFPAGKTMSAAIAHQPYDMSRVFLLPSSTRLYFFAPKFCAANTDTAEPNESKGCVTKVSIFDPVT